MPGTSNASQMPPFYMYEGFQTVRHLVCNSVCQMHVAFMLGVRDILDPEERLCTDHTCTNMIPRTEASIGGGGGGEGAVVPQ